MAIRRHHRHLTDAGAATMRRLIWFEMRRVGVPLAFIGTIFSVSGEAIRRELAKGYPEDADEDLVEMATRDIADHAHLIPGHDRGR